MEVPGPRVITREEVGKIAQNRREGRIAIVWWYDFFQRKPESFMEEAHFASALCELMLEEGWSLIRMKRNSNGGDFPPSYLFEKIVNTDFDVMDCN